MYKVCEGGRPERWSTHWVMASPKTENRRQPLYNAGLSREEGASPGVGEGCCPLSPGLGMHIMYTVCGLPTPPCLYNWKGGGRKGTQTNNDAQRFRFPLVLKTAFNTAPDIQCSQQPQPPGQERNRPADDTEKTYLHKPGLLGAPGKAGHSKETCREQGKKKRSSPQEAQRSFALQHDALQLGRGRDLGGCLPK